MAMISTVLIAVSPFTSAAVSRHPDEGIPDNEEMPLGGDDIQGGNA